MQCKVRNSSTFQALMWCMYTPRKWSKSPWCADKFWIPISMQIVQPQLCLVQASCLYLLRPSWSFWTIINQKGFCPYLMDWYLHVFRRRNQLISNLTVKISGGCGKSRSKWWIVFILRNCGGIFSGVKIGLGLPCCFSIFVDCSSQYHLETGAIILPSSSAHTQLFIV